MLDHVFYVDLCNEYPHPDWPKFLPEGYRNSFAHADYKPWMEESIAILRREYPEIPFTFSFFGDEWLRTDDTLPYLDFLELHIWVDNFSDFEERLGYTWDMHNNLEYNLWQKAEKLYRDHEKHWKDRLRAGIAFAAEASRNMGLPLVTTESWGPITYKDWPLLDWSWVKEICAYGVEKAVETRRWASMCTSNFCGPQFTGMWEDVEWHRRQMDLIRAGAMDFQIMPPSHQ